MTVAQNANAWRRDRAFVPFVLPDTIASLPRRPFEFSRAGRDEAAAASLEPGALFRRLLRDQESEASLLVARRVLDAFLPTDGHHEDGPYEEHEDGPYEETEAGTIATHVAEVRAELAGMTGSLSGLEPELRQAVVRQRAPLALLGGCWLDNVSQPATQPSVIVNRLFAHHLTLRGDGNTERGLAHLRRRALENEGVYLPSIAAVDFLDKAQARPLTALHGCFYLALSRLPANFLPEVVGVHYVFHALGTDDLLTGTPSLLSAAELRETLAAYLALAGPDERRRLHTAVRLTLDLEREHVTMLAELASWRAGLTLESKVAEIISRHAPLAGTQHGGVRVGDSLLSDIFRVPGHSQGETAALDLAAFLADLRDSRYLRPSGSADGGCRLTDAMKFGGPMFGIFDEREAATFRAWAASVQSGERPRIEISPDTVGEEQAERWSAAIARSAPADVVVAEAEPRDHRELFHRLVNIENFPNSLPLAAERAERCFKDAEILFVHGGGGRYTDATWFDYSPQALYERAERIYWEKLVEPYQPLQEIPDRDEVLFRQTTYYLTYLIDGAWLHRLAHLGHDERESDGMLFSIYADEMGNGDLRKNHITLTHRVLASAGIELPHIRDEAFMEQDELPDDLYGFAIQQLCMCLFPDRFYNEILGYNLAIEMFGSGEMRLHEIQKLRHHGIDTCYEQAHLTIDNFSAGHAKQAADIIVSHLDAVRRTLGDAAVAAEWRRVWRGYASFAYFLEQPLLEKIAVGAEPGAKSPSPPADSTNDAVAELVI
ncbi:iron-containing redox enzyme family protein [Streptomyces sporangiiformans]|uniref:Iron-containing redox enzyme family protein n=1 Tax=Streptomyces sporangiiformans TaxID=2315329 RepID=A0A505DDW7_9ACTN|nr:iron-containing redox enzyme family protein [Streptomyces sporangiiformans]TPQ20900.1 iron-containing redox enzyme family protein [Streptomyces sporangiiformans]